MSWRTRQTPSGLLRAVRNHLVSDGKLFVAEPKAYPGQVLRAPQRRTFSHRSLRAMLTMAGFRIVECYGKEGPFVVIKAESAIECQSLIEATDAQIRGDGEGALAGFDRAIRSPIPELRLEGLLGLADLQVSVGNGDGACRAFFEAQTHAPDDARPLAGLSQVMMMAGDAERAMRFAKHGVKVDPSEPAAAIAWASAQAPDTDEAVFAWRNAHNLAPDRLDVAIELANAASAVNRHALGLFALEHVRGYGDNHGAAIHVAVARALARLGRMADARLKGRGFHQELRTNDLDVARLRRENRVHDQNGAATCGRQSPQHTMAHLAEPGPQSRFRGCWRGQHASRRIRRLLLIDDQTERCLELRDQFVEEGYDVVVLIDSSDTLDYVDEYPPDIILINVTLRDASGVELCGELRMRDDLRMTPIILISEDHEDEESVVRGLLAGADDYVTRLNRRAELNARIRVQLRNRRDRELLQWAELQRVRLKDAALCDPLTSLPNRRALDRAVAKGLSTGGPMMLMLVDIDHFRSVNDRFGHPVGDSVLKEVAKQLERRARKDDVVGRFGGGEFVVLIRGAPSHLAQAIAERYRLGLEEHNFAVAGGPPRITISVGVAVFDGSETILLSREALLEVANQALYEAKRAGRNRVVIAHVVPDAPDAPDAPETPTVPHPGA